LKEFEIGGHCRFDSELGEQLLQCTQLSDITFRVIEVEFQAPTITMFYNLCSRARILRLGGISTYGARSFIPLPPPPQDELLNTRHIEYLNTDYLGGFSAFKELLKRMPNLEILKLSQYEITADNVIVYTDLLKSRSFHTIKELSLFDGTDDMVAITLDSMKDLIKFECSSDFSEQSINSFIKRHANSIRDIDLLNSKTATGSIIEKILTRCPNLEELRAKEIHASDLARISSSKDCSDAEDPSRYLWDITLSQDWVCHNLKSLILEFDMSIDNSQLDMTTKAGIEEYQRRSEVIHGHTMRQLTKLRSLEHLQMAHSKYDRISLDLRPKSYGGFLEQLKEFKKLKSFKNLENSKLVDIKWIKKNLPNLDFKNLPYGYGLDITIKWW
jgi:hypothetical protein